MLTGFNPTSKTAKLFALGAAALTTSTLAIDFSPEARRRVASYQQGLGNLPGAPGLSQILGGPAYGENGLLPNGPDWREAIQRDVTARQAPTGGGGPVFGTGAAVSAEGASAGAGPQANGKAEAAPKAEAATPTRSQRLREGMKHHAAGYLQFSGVLASYVGVQLLLEVDKGNMKAEEFWPELQKLVLSPEAAAGYMSFVGVHSMAEKILAAGSKWGTAVPEAAALKAAATRMSTVTALRRMFLKQGILLTVVAGVIEVSVHWWKNMAQRPWEQDNPDASRMRGMNVVGSFLHALTQKGNFTNTVGHVFSSFMKAVEEVDWIGLAVTSAAFVAGMTLTAFAPGWIQLVAGFVLSDLASRYLVPWIHRQITSRWGRFTAADSLKYAYRVAMGVTPKLPQRPNSQTLGERIDSMMERAEEDVPTAFDKELEPIRVDYEDKVEALQLAASGKLTSDLTNDVTHDWFLKRAQWQQIAQLPGVVGTAARDAFTSAKTYLARAETQMQSLESIFRTNDRRIEPMDQLWQAMRKDLDGATDIDQVWEISGPYLSKMRKFTWGRVGYQDENPQRIGVERVIQLTSMRYLNLVMQRMAIRDTDPQLDRYTQDANATVYRAARTRAQEIRARLALLRLPELAKEGRKVVRTTSGRQSYNPYGGGASTPADSHAADLRRIESFVKQRSHRLTSERQRVQRQQQTSESLDRQRVSKTNGAFQLVEAGLARGEPLDTYVPVLSVLLLAEDVESSHPLVRASVDHIMAKLRASPGKEKDLLTAYNPLISALIYGHRGVVPRQLIEMFRKHGVKPKFAGDIYQAPETGIPGFSAPQWPPPGYEPRTEAERAMLAATELMALQKQTWDSGKEYQRLEENLTLIENQSAGLVTAQPLGYARAEHITRLRLREASNLIRELEEAENVIDRLGYLEDRNIAGLDRPAWIVPHFDRDEGEFLELEDKVIAQEQRMDALVSEYYQLFRESVQVMDRVYARAPSAFPQPAARTEAPSTTSTTTDPETRALLEAWIKNNGKTSAPRTSSPAEKDEFDRLMARMRASNRGGFDSLYGLDRDRPEPLKRDQFNLADGLTVSNDHQAYQPLLTFLKDTDPDRLSYALSVKEPQLSPRRSPEQVYRQTDRDREQESRDAVASGRTDPALETVFRMPSRGVSTIQCHGNNSQNCRPQASLRTSPSRLSLERAYANDPVFHGSKAWFLDKPEALKDAWGRWWRLKRLVKQLDSVQAAYQATKTKLNPLRERLYPEETRPTTPLPKVPSRF